MVIKEIRNLPHYSFVENAAYVGRKVEKKTEIDDHDPLLDIIFAPDPLTGVPRSDLALIMSKDTSPEVSRFIQDTLMRPGDPLSSVDDPDFALDACRQRGESDLAYADRLRELCNPKSVE